MATSPDFTMENFERFLENLKGSILPKYASKNDLKEAMEDIELTKEDVIQALGYTPEQDLTEEQDRLLQSLIIRDGELLIKNSEGVYVNILENSLNVYATFEDIEAMFK